MKFTTTNAQFRQTWGAVFVQNMAACGIQIIPQYVPHPGGSVTRRAWPAATSSRRVRLGGRARSGGPDPLRVRPDPLPSNNWEGQNTMGWCNKAASDAIVKANNTLIKDERKAGVRHRQDEFVKDMVSLPVFQRVEADGWSNDLKASSPMQRSTPLRTLPNGAMKDGSDTIVAGFSQEPASMYTNVESIAAGVEVCLCRRLRPDVHKVELRLPAVTAGTARHDREWPRDQRRGRCQGRRHGL